MSPMEIAFLAALVNLAHGRATHTRTAEVRQIHRGITLWTGSVATFRLHDHPTATECYAWMCDEVPEATCPVMFLNSETIDSPAAAVRGYVRQLCLELAA